MSETFVEDLFKALLEFAKEMLAEVGQFHPFGATVDLQGNVVYAPFRRDSQIPSPEEIVSILTRTFQEQAEAGEVRACGICMDVLILPPGEEQRRDAIGLKMEEENGEAVDIYVPYRKKGAGGIDYEEPIATPRSPEIFIPRERIH
jgi:hypothetical protein